MSYRHANFLRELSKFAAGLITADLIMGIWVVTNKLYYLSFLGITLTPLLIKTWVTADIILLFLLIHYGWQIDIPISYEKRIFLTITGLILSLVAILHLLRIIFSVYMIIGGVIIPQWASMLGVVIISFLAYTSFYFARHR